MVILYYNYLIIISEVDQVKTEIKSAIVQLIKADITKEREIHELVSNIIGKYGRIHVLVNVVDGYLGGKSIYQLEEKEWDLMMTVNLKSAFLISKYVVPQMISSK